MIINDQNGNSIDTNKLDDITAAVYEDLANLHERFKALGVSFLASAKYKDSTVAGSVFVQKGTDFLDLIQFVDERVAEITDGEFRIKIVKSDV